jgi:hypothetical protein
VDIAGELSRPGSIYSLGKGQGPSLLCQPSVAPEQKTFLVAIRPDFTKDDFYNPDKITRIKQFDKGIATLGIQSIPSKYFLEVY